MKIPPILKYALIALNLPLSAIALAEPVTFPISRAITDNTGRTMQGTIISKTDTGIKFRRTSDGLEFMVPLEKLTENDRAYIAEAKNAPVSKTDALSATSSITLQVQVEKRQSPEGGKEYLESIATPVFVRGQDMNDSPALVRISRTQTNVKEEHKNIMSNTFVDVAIEPVKLDYPIQKSNPVTFDWFAEVWQDGKLICKSYHSDRMMEKLPPPAKVGSDTFRLYPRANR